MERSSQHSDDREPDLADLKRYLPLKFATFAWILFLLGLATYGLAATWASWWPYPQLNLTDTASARPAAYSFFSGTIGSCLYALRGWYWAVGPPSATDSRRRYDPNWALWYLARPVMGSFLGLFSFILLRGGVAAFGSPTEGTNSSAAHSAVAFLAGYSATEVLNWLTVTSRRIFQVPTQDLESPRTGDLATGSNGPDNDEIKG